MKVNIVVILFTLRCPLTGIYKSAGTLANVIEFRTPDGGGHPTIFDAAVLTRSAIVRLIDRTLQRPNGG